LNDKILIKGGLAIGVPGEVRAYKKAYDEFGGGVQWRELFEPTIRLCRDGFVISTPQATAIRQTTSVILNNTALRFVLNKSFNKRTNQCFFIENFLSKI
jgi:gamma-glutamyltranspeptidase/glutathione hydrolase/leukotriene-C4 hydrolase